MNFDAVAQCTQQVAPATMRAIAQVESSMNPYAIGVVNGKLDRQPRTLLEAVATASALQRQGVRFSAGLTQVYVGNWSRLGLDVQSVFQPCVNVRAGSQILRDCYVRASAKNDEGGQVPLRWAISCYYSNNFETGFKEGYVTRVVNAAIAFSPGP